jgi:hypothetical protein
LLVPWLRLAVSNWSNEVETLPLLWLMMDRSSFWNTLLKRLKTMHSDQHNRHICCNTALAENFRLFLPAMIFITITNPIWYLVSQSWWFLGFRVTSRSSGKLLYEGGLSVVIYIYSVLHKSLLQIFRSFKGNTVCKDIGKISCCSVLLLFEDS